MKTPRRALFAAVLWTALGLAAQPRRPKRLHCAGRLGPGKRLGRVVEGLYQAVRNRDEVRIVPWTSYADRFLNELNSTASCVT